MQPLRELEARVRDVDAAVSTGTPTASIASTSDCTRDRTMSRSWIIRSNTTSISRLRSGNVPSRWTSMNRGSVEQRARRGDGGIEALGLADGETRPASAAA